MPLALAQLIHAEFLRLSHAAVAVFAPLVSGAFAWVSAGGLSSAMGVFECIYIGVERPWWKRRFIAMGYVFAGLVVVTILTALGLAIATVSKTVGVVLGFVLPVVAPVALVALFFRIATQRTGGPRRTVLPGAVLTVVLWGASSTLFSVYVSRIASYATLYGNLATVAIALLWLWIASLALLVGGEVNALMDGIGLDDEVPESVFPFEGHEDDLPGGDLRMKSVLPPERAPEVATPPPPTTGGQRA